MENASPGIDPSKIKDVEYAQVAARDADDDLLRECASLFSRNYGVWSTRIENKQMQGQPIRLPFSALRRYLVGDTAWIATARLNKELVGYAIAAHLPYRKSQLDR